MAQEARFPIRLTDAFFSSLQFRRVPEMPDPLQVNFNVHVRVHGEQFPDNLQINLQVETLDDQPLMLSLELVGLFRVVGDRPGLDRSVLPDFVNERAIHMLWPYVVQMIRQVTAQMGIKPVNFPTPYKFEFALPEQATESTQQE
jgi:preprotein translocase subunit SecB